MVKLSENLSSNTLFHFTNSKTSLLRILKYNFMPRYCLENTDYLKGRAIEKIEMAYPMVCFCDIPLSKIKNHLDTYGNYGIGLKKTWGYRNSLSPIIYTRKGARTSDNLKNLINWSKKNLPHLNEQSQIEIRSFLSDIFMFTKPYRGKMYRDGEYITRRFYDEREWRWIPQIKNDGVLRHLLKEEFLDSDFKFQQNKIVGERYRLNFTPDDINYLIIDNDGELDNFIRYIEKIKNGYDSATIKRLTTRIINRNRIVYDF